MTTEDDFEAYRREQLTQVRDIQVTDEGLQSFEKGLVRIIVRSEGSSQELKLNELELQALAGAAGAYLVKKIPGAPDVAALKAAIRAAEEHTEQLAGADDTQRIDLQDAVMAELKAWKDYSHGLERFLATQQRATVTIRDSAGVPLFEIEATRPEALAVQDVLKSPAMARRLSTAAAKAVDASLTSPPLDPTPWRVRPVEGRITKGRTRFATLREGYSNAIMEFVPREEYEQDWKRYPQRQQPTLDPEPWRWGQQRFEDADPAGQDFDFSPEWDPRPEYIQEKGYYA